MRRSIPAIIERDLATGLLLGKVPGIPGAHTQGRTVQEVRDHLEEVPRLLVEDGAIQLESEFVATIAVRVP